MPLKTLWRRLQSMPLYHRARTRAIRPRLGRELERWEAGGRLGPPPHLEKQRVLLDYARRYDLRVLVETGTHYGDMVDAMKTHFTCICSIELSPTLFDAARRRFAGDTHVQVVHGDSAVALGPIVARLDGPALFWLDGHYSGHLTARGVTDTPIREELTRILTSREAGHVVLIDDARCFGSHPGYPSIPELTALIRALRPEVTVHVEHDCIRITPPIDAAVR